MTVALSVRASSSCTFDVLENSPHAIHASDIVSGAVISASLALRQPLPAPHIGVACAGAAEMNERGQVLFALERREFHMMARKRSCHTAIEIRRREFHRMRGDYPGVQAIEPT